VYLHPAIMVQPEALGPRHIFDMRVAENVIMQPRLFLCPP
jgi:hypothetical protein